MNTVNKFIGVLAGIGKNMNISKKDLVLGAIGSVIITLALLGCKHEPDTNNGPMPEFKPSNISNLTVENVKFNDAEDVMANEITVSWTLVDHPDVVANANINTRNSEIVVTLQRGDNIIATKKFAADAISGIINAPRVPQAERVVENLTVRAQAFNGTNGGTAANNSATTKVPSVERQAIIDWFAAEERRISSTQIPTANNTRPLPLLINTLQTYARNILSDGVIDNSTLREAAKKVVDEYNKGFTPTRDFTISRLNKSSIRNENHLANHIVRNSRVRLVTQECQAQRLSACHLT